MRMDEGFPDGTTVVGRWWISDTDDSEPEPVACVERQGPTPFHPEPGRETWQRRRYWRFDRWESRSMRHPKTPGEEPVVPS